MKRFVIVGLGTFGAATAEALFDRGHEVVALDLDEEKVERMAARVTRAAVGDARQKEVLERVGAKGADAAVVSTGGDLSAALLAVLALRDLGIRDVYAKAVSDDHARIMHRLGVTETVFPERETALNLAVRMVRSESLLNYVRLGSGLSLQEMAVPKKFEGRTLRELALPRNYRVSVVAVHDMLTDAIDAVPDPDLKLLDSHTLIVTGTEDNLGRIAKVK